MRKAEATLTYGHIGEPPVDTLKGAPHEISALAVDLANMLFNRVDYRLPYDLNALSLHVDRAIHTRIEESGFYIELDLTHYYETAYRMEV